MKTALLPRRAALAASLLAAFLLAGSPAPAAPPALTLHPLFSAHAVLEKASVVPVWGRAEPGAAVTVLLVPEGAAASPDAAERAVAKATATADDTGKWKAALDLSAAAQGPFELIADDAQPDHRLVVPDVVVGEVWLGSGQSNMQYELSWSTGSKEEIARSANPMVREFLVSRTMDTAPAENCKGKWMVASPETSGTFSGTGYYFAKALQKGLGRPVGVINSSMGGTPIEFWLSGAAFERDPALKAFKDKCIADRDAYQKAMQDYKSVHQAWIEKYSRQDPARPADLPAGVTAPDKSPFAEPTADTADWKPVTLPAGFPEMGLPDAGVSWLRRTVTIPPESAGKQVRLTGPALTAIDALYWNGKKVGELRPEHGRLRSPRGYFIQPADVPAGEVTVAVRLYNHLGAGTAPVGGFKMGLTDVKEAIPLDGEWLAKSEAPLPAIPPEAVAEYPEIPATPEYPGIAPTFLFNGMIASLMPYRIAGAIWYQGESNAQRAYQYRTLLPLLISDWRRQWGQGDFPFLIAQLANHMRSRGDFPDSKWAVVRESQAKALALPNTGMAVLIDVGEEEDIHPRDKKSVGDRLAALALAETYGQAVPARGPRYRSFAVEGPAVRVRLDAGDGAEKRGAGRLVALPIPETYTPASVRPAITRPVPRKSPGSQLEGFAICGEDRQWHWADAVIDDRDASVLVASPEVPRPVAVRYAWGDNPVCNLANDARLPAEPFRTDDFEVITQTPEPTK